MTVLNSMVSGECNLERMWKVVVVVTPFNESSQHYPEPWRHKENHKKKLIRIADLGTDKKPNTPNYEIGIGGGVNFMRLHSTVLGQLVEGKVKKTQKEPVMA